MTAILERRESESLWGRVCNCQDLDQLLNPLKMNMSRVEQQVIRYPAAKATPVGYLPDPASFNKFRVPASSKKSEQS
jgi:hypothetical protein